MPYPNKQQRAQAIKRRKAIWEALHPGETGGKNLPTCLSDGRKGGPQHEQGFAAETAAVSGESKRAINQHLARAEALGDDLPRVAGTSLDKGVVANSRIRKTLPSFRLLDRLFDRDNLGVYRAEMVPKKLAPLQQVGHNITVSLIFSGIDFRVHHLQLALNLNGLSIQIQQLGVQLQHKLCFSSISICSSARCFFYQPIGFSRARHRSRRGRKSFGPTGRFNSVRGFKTSHHLCSQRPLVLRSRSNQALLEVGRKTDVSLNFFRGHQRIIQAKCLQATKHFATLQAKQSAT